MILNLINNNYYWHFVTEHLWQTLLSCVHWMWNKMKWNEWHHKMSFVIAIFHSNSIVHKANITTQFYHFFSFDFICIEIFLFSFFSFISLWSLQQQHYHHHWQWCKWDQLNQLKLKPIVFFNLLKQTLLSILNGIDDVDSFIWFNPLLCVFQWYALHDPLAI